MANEMEIKKNENQENENVAETVPAETMLDKVKKFRLGKTAKKILTGIGVTALAAVGVAIGVNIGKGHGENDETFDGEVDYEQDLDYAYPDDDEIPDAMAQ